MFPSGETALYDVNLEAADKEFLVLFYNPNIEDGEYERRKNELIRFISETGWADFIDCDHNTREFYSAAKGLEFEKEGVLIDLFYILW